MLTAHTTGVLDLSDAGAGPCTVHVLLHFLAAPHETGLTEDVIQTSAGTLQSGGDTGSNSSSSSNSISTTTTTTTTTTTSTAVVECNTTHRFRPNRGVGPEEEDSDDPNYFFAELPPPPPPPSSSSSTSSSSTHEGGAPSSDVHGAFLTWLVRAALLMSMQLNTRALSHSLCFLPPSLQRYVPDGTAHEGITVTTTTAAAASSSSTLSQSPPSLSSRKRRRGGRRPSRRHGGSLASSSQERDDDETVIDADSHSNDDDDDGAGARGDETSLIGKALPLACPSALNTAYHGRSTADEAEAEEDEDEDDVFVVSPTFKAVASPSSYNPHDPMKARVSSFFQPIPHGYSKQQQQQQLQRNSLVSLSGFRSQALKPGEESSMEPISLSSHSSSSSSSSSSSASSSSSSSTSSSSSSSASAFAAAEWFWTERTTPLYALFKALSLARNRIGTDGARALSHLLRLNKSIVTLDLTATRLSTVAMQVLCEALPASRVEGLSLSHAPGFRQNHLGSDGAAALHKCLSNPATRVRKLILAGVGRAGISELVNLQTFSQACSVEHLDLRGNGIDNAMLIRLLHDLAEAAATNNNKDELTTSPPGENATKRMTYPSTSAPAATQRQSFNASMYPLPHLSPPTTGRGIATSTTTTTSTSPSAAASTQQRQQQQQQGDVGQGSISGRARRPGLRCLVLSDNALNEQDGCGVALTQFLTAMPMLKQLYVGNNYFSATFTALLAKVMLTGDASSVADLAAALDGKSSSSFGKGSNLGASSSSSSSSSAGQSTSYFTPLSAAVINGSNIYNLGAVPPVTSSSAPNATGSSSSSSSSSSSTSSSSSSSSSASVMATARAASASASVFASRHVAAVAEIVSNRRRDRAAVKDAQLPPIHQLSSSSSSRATSPPSTTPATTDSLTGGLHGSITSSSSGTNGTGGDNGGKRVPQTPSSLSSKRSRSLSPAPRAAKPTTHVTASDGPTPRDASKQGQSAGATGGAGGAGQGDLASEGLIDPNTGEVVGLNQTISSLRETNIKAQQADLSSALNKIRPYGQRGRPNLPFVPPPPSSRVIAEARGADVSNSVRMGRYEAWGTDKAHMRARPLAISALEMALGSGPADPPNASPIGGPVWGAGPSGEALRDTAGPGKRVQGGTFAKAGAGVGLSALLSSAGNAKRGPALAAATAALVSTGIIGGRHIWGLDERQQLANPKGIDLKELVLAEHRKMEERTKKASKAARANARRRVDDLLADADGHETSARGEKREGEGDTEDDEGQRNEAEEVIGSDRIVHDLLIPNAKDNVTSDLPFSSSSSSSYSSSTSSSSSPSQRQRQQLRRRVTNDQSSLTAPASPSTPPFTPSSPPSTRRTQSQRHIRRDTATFSPSSSFSERGGGGVQEESVLARRASQAESRMQLGLLTAQRLSQRPSLHTLSLDGCVQLGDRGLAHLAQVIEDPACSVSYLSLANCSIADVTPLVRVLGNSKSLLKVDLRSNFISPEGGALIFLALLQNTNMTHLNLSSNLIDDTAGRTLAAVVATNKVIEEIYLRDNRFTSITAALVLRSLQTTRKWGGVVAPTLLTAHESGSDPDPLSTPTMSSSSSAHASRTDPVSELRVLDFTLNKVDESFLARISNLLGRMDEDRGHTRVARIEAKLAQDTAGHEEALRVFEKVKSAHESCITMGKELHALQREAIEEERAGEAEIAQLYAQLKAAKARSERLTGSELRRELDSLTERRGRADIEFERSLEAYKSSLLDAKKQRLLSHHRLISAQELLLSIRAARLDDHAQTLRLEDELGAETAVLAEMRAEYLRYAAMLRTETGRVMSAYMCSLSRFARLLHHRSAPGAGGSGNSAGTSLVLTSQHSASTLSGVPLLADSAASHQQPSHHHASTTGANAAAAAAAAASGGGGSGRIAGRPSLSALARGSMIFKDGVLVPSIPSSSGSISMPAGSVLPPSASTAGTTAAGGPGAHYTFQWLWPLRLDHIPSLALRELDLPAATQWLFGSSAGLALPADANTPEHSLVLFASRLSPEVARLHKGLLDALPRPSAKLMRTVTASKQHEASSDLVVAPPTSSVHSSSTSSGSAGSSTTSVVATASAKSSTSEASSLASASAQTTPSRAQPVTPPPPMPLSTLFVDPSQPLPLWALQPVAWSDVIQVSVRIETFASRISVAVEVPRNTAPLNGGGLPPLLVDVLATRKPTSTRNSFSRMIAAASSNANESAAITATGCSGFQREAPYGGHQNGMMGTGLPGLSFRGAPPASPSSSSADSLTLSSVLALPSGRGFVSGVSVVVLLDDVSNRKRIDWLKARRERELAEALAAGDTTRLAQLQSSLRGSSRRGAGAAVGGGGGVSGSGGSSMDGAEADPNLGELWVPRDITGEALHKTIEHFISYNEWGSIASSTPAILGSRYSVSHALIGASYTASGGAGGSGVPRASGSISGSDSSSISLASSSSSSSPMSAAAAAAASVALAISRPRVFYIPCFGADAAEIKVRIHT